MTQFLPTPLINLFAARDPIPYLPPVQKLTHERYTIGYHGVGEWICHFEDPKDTPVPPKYETKDERRERKCLAKMERDAYELEKNIAFWNPNTILNCATSDPYKTVFVGRINYDTSEKRLRREFETYGAIRQISMIQDTKTGKPRGYAFVEYENSRATRSAFKNADGKKIDGRRIIVDIERGRTVNGWLPRRLGGGLGGTRRGGPEVNIKSSGREDPNREKRNESTDRVSRDRVSGRERDWSKDRDSSLDRRHGRDKDRSRSRSHHDRVPRNWDRDSIEYRDRDKYHHRREKKRKRSRSHSRDRRVGEKVDSSRDYEKRLHSRKHSKSRSRDRKKRRRSRSRDKERKREKEDRRRANKRVGHSKENRTEIRIKTEKHPYVDSDSVVRVKKEQIPVTEQQIQVKKEPSPATEQPIQVKQEQVDLREDENDLSVPISKSVSDYLGNDVKCSIKPEPCDPSSIY